jgi:hypothetical protein
MVKWFTMETMGGGFHRQAWMSGVRAWNRFARSRRCLGSLMRVLRLLALVFAVLTATAETQVHACPTQASTDAQVSVGLVDSGDGTEPPAETVAPTDIPATGVPTIPATDPPPTQTVTPSPTTGGATTTEIPATATEPPAAGSRPGVRSFMQQDDLLDCEPATQDPLGPASGDGGQGNHSSSTGSGVDSGALPVTTLPSTGAAPDPQPASSLLLVLGCACIFAASGIAARRPRR